MATAKQLKRAVLAVFAITLVQVSFYGPLSGGRSPPDGRRSLPERNLRTIVSTLGEAVDPARRLKPWPILPSFQPWTRNPDLQPDTCEAYFGNGYIREHRVLESIPEQEVDGTNRASRQDGREESGSFRCFYSEALQASVCEARKVVMNLEKIKVARGGEELQDVMGRNEDDEVPEYSRGAFQIRVRKGGGALVDEMALDQLMPRGTVERHPMRSLLRSLESVDSGSVQCVERIKEPTVFVTRYEYANLFHTATDWFSAYVSSRVAGLTGRPRVVFLDGHCKSPLDDGWEAMFSNVTFAMHFRGPVCFDHAIFAPLGYATPMFQQITSTLACAGSSVEELDEARMRGAEENRMARMREVSEFLAASFETRPENSAIVESTAREGGQAQEVNVVFIRREDYLAHPRHSGRPEYRVSNEEELYQELKKWAKAESTEMRKVNIVNGLFAHLPLREQVKIVRGATVLIGAHGAGLTHLLFALPTTKVLELSPPHHNGPHYALMSLWKGMDYRVIEMDSSVANVRQITTIVNEMLKDTLNR